MIFSPTIIFRNEDYSFGNTLWIKPTRQKSSSWHDRLWWCGLEPSHLLLESLSGSSGGFPGNVIYSKNDFVLSAEMKHLFVYASAMLAISSIFVQSESMVIAGFFSRMIFTEKVFSANVSLRCAFSIFALTAMSNCSVSCCGYLSGTSVCLFHFFLLKGYTHTPVCWVSS